MGSDKVQKMQIESSSREAMHIGMSVGRLEVDTLRNVIRGNVPSSTPFIGHQRKAERLRHSFDMLRVVENRLDPIFTDRLSFRRSFASFPNDRASVSAFNMVVIGQIGLYPS